MFCSDTVVRANRSITDPEAFRRIYSSTKSFRTAEYYDVVKNGREFDIFSERDEKFYG